MNLEQLLTSNDYKKTSDPMHLRFKCIFCGEQKYKLYIHKRKGVYLCFHCNASGRVNGQAQTSLDAFQERVSCFLDGGSRGNSAESLELPKEILPVRRGDGIPYTYLRKRQVTDEEIEKYKIGYCSEGRYQERIILPVFDEGGLVYYCARAYTGRTPKYLNVGSGRNKIIFKTFTGLVDFCILVEGVFTAIYIGRLFPAIATLGKVVSEFQAQKIAQVAKKVFVMLDSNAHKECCQAMQKLSHYIETVPILIDKDAPDSYSYKELTNLIGGKI